jgi:hypothetical protein
VLFLFAVHLSSAAEADDRTKNRSPDGKFAMLLTDDTEEGRVKIQLIEVSSGKVVLDVAESGHPHAEDCKLLWAPDSQRFDVHENRRGGDTTVYFRSESVFTESPLQELGGCATAAQKKSSKRRAATNLSNTTLCLKSGSSRAL